MDIQTRAAIEKEVAHLIKLVDGYPTVSILKNINAAILAGVDVDEILSALDSVFLEKQKFISFKDCWGGT